MKPTVKLILILFGLAYLISPVDIIPDLLIPWVGWIDDSLVLWCVYYLIRYGELPWFRFKRPGKPKPVQGRPTPRGKRTSAGASTGTSAGGTASQKEENGQTAEESRQAKETDAALTPYETLGVEPRASWDEIQKAYKEKIKQYHPDKLSHLGEEFSSLANEKFLEIQAAFNHLKAVHKKS